MDWLTSFFIRNYQMVYFVYGLVFFQIGFAISLQSRSLSSFRMARRLRALAAFGFLHGLSEWAVVFIPIQQVYVDERQLLLLYFLERALTAVSFTFLFSFGLNLMLDTIRRYRRLAVLPWVILTVWLVFTLAAMRWGSWRETGEWLVLCDVFSRYFLGFPGSLAAAVALYWQRHEIEAIGPAKVMSGLKGAVAAFGLYGIFAGLVVPVAPVFPATWLNQQDFFKMVGIPIPVFRAAMGVVMLYSMVRTLDVFNLEYLRRLDILERQQAVAQERERIGRDLHDGVIQDIYAVGLALEDCRFMMDEEPGLCREQLKKCMDRLNMTIRNIRNYILGLAPVSFQERNLHAGINRLVHDFEANTLITSQVGWSGPPVELDQVVVSHIYHIIQEILSNVARHACATMVWVNVRVTAGKLEISVLDNGVGFDVKQQQCREASVEGGRGLCNISERVRLLGGSWELISHRGAGTKVLCYVPLGGVFNDSHSPG